MIGLREFVVALVLLIGSCHTFVPELESTVHPLVVRYKLESIGFLACFNKNCSLEINVYNENVNFWTDPEVIDFGQEVDILVGGLREQTTYTLRHKIKNKDGFVIDIGSELEFTTGSANFTIPTIDVIVENQTDDFLLFSPLNGVSSAFALDDEGELVWYNLGSFGILTRPLDNGRFLFNINGFVTETNLLGEAIRQTTLEEVDSQTSFDILGFHHETNRLPGDRTVVLAFVGAEPEPGRFMIGDAVIVLDPDFNVEWEWNAFDHLDTDRMDILGETCNGFTCPTLGPDTEDWMHTNAVAYSPDDGNLILSVRNQDWIIKIDYADGQGNGAIIWRLGPEGDFAVISNDPDPWVTHMHDPNLIDNRLSVYDNGNTRCEFNNDCESRGQVYELDEKNLMADLIFNERLGVYAFALGASQETEDGYHFNSGSAPEGTLVDDFDENGNLIYSIFIPDVSTYRTFKTDNF